MTTTTSKNITTTMIVIKTMSMGMTTTIPIS